MSADATAVPVNATIQPATAPTEVKQGPKSPGEHRADIVAAARAMPREVSSEDLAKLEPQKGGAPGATPPATATPPPAQPQTDPSKEPTPPGDADKDSPTARIAHLTRRNREERIAREAAEAKAADAIAAKEAAEKQVATFAEIKKDFDKNPLAAIEKMSEGLPLGEAKSAWAALVDRVASGGEPLTAEQVAAAEKIAQEQARDERLKKLEDARKADEDADNAAKAEELKAVEAEQQAGAVNYITTKLITAEKHPNLIGVAAEAAAEAIYMVNDAIKQAFEAKKRALPHPIDFAESERLTVMALDGLQTHYAELHGKLSPKSPTQTGETPAQTTPPAANMPPIATNPPQSNPAVITEVATSQQVGPRTITNAVGGDSPPAAQPKRMTADEARASAMEAARRLPPL